jgi:chromosome partitioning protein
MIVFSYRVSCHILNHFSNLIFYVRVASVTQIICIANQKGGVGKTTTAVNLSAALAIYEHKTLLVDCDPQGNATTGVGIDKTRLPRTLYHGLIGKADVRSLMTDSEIETLKVLPGRVELIGFDVEMMAQSGRETALRRLLKPLEAEFEYIVIDCPPSLSLLTVNAMTAADTLLIPLQCEFYALEGLSQLVQTYHRIRKSFNPRLQIAGILLTMFDKRTNLSHQVAEDAAEYFKGLVFQTIIPRSVRLGESPSFGKPILLYDAASVGSQSYFSLAREIISNAKVN